MLFIIYYELDPGADPRDILTAYQKIQEAGVELEKWDTKGWYLTPEDWGVAIVESDTVDDMMKNVYQWKLALPGFFKKYNVAPVAEVEQVVPVLAKMMRKFK
jgi:hypothetical protein